MDFSILINQGGPIMPVILGAAFLGYVLAFERLMVWGWWFFLERTLYRALQTEVLSPLLDHPPRHATPLYELLIVARSHIKTSAVAGAVTGAAIGDKLVEREILARLPQVEARISTIGWLAGILPMLGLLGTVSGMILTFRNLAETTSREVLSGGLSEALWTTEVGLLGALPLLLVHHLLTRMRVRWLNRLELGLALLAEPSAPAHSGETP